MFKKLAVLGIVLLINTAIYAQPGKKLPKAIKAAASFKQSAAYQAALRHAQAIQSSTAAKLSAQPLGQTASTAVPVRYVHKSPQEHLDELENFVKEYGYFPCRNQPQGEHLYPNIQYLLKRLDPQHPIALRIQELKLQFGKNKKTPQEHLDELENFIKEYNFFPRRNLPQESSLYQNAQYLVKRLDPQHPIALRIQELQQQYGKNKKPPQNRLDELESFIAQHGHFPRTNHSQEIPLYQNVQYLVKRLGPQHPITWRIQELQAQTRKHSLHTSLGWLYELEDFIAANDHYPALGNTLEENQLYFELDKLINTLGMDDPVSVRIKQIRAQYLQTQETKQ